LTDELEPHVTELDDVACLDDSAPEIGTVYPNAVARPLVDDLESPLAEGVNLTVQSRHRVMIYGNRRIFGPANRQPVVGQRILFSGGRAGKHDETVRLLEERGMGRAKGRRYPRTRRCRLPEIVRDHRADHRERYVLDHRVVLNDDSIIPNLYEVAVYEFVRLRYTVPVDVDAVVAREIFEVVRTRRARRSRRRLGITGNAVLLANLCVVARDVALGQPDRVPVLATDGVVVPSERYDRPPSFVVLDDQLPHIGLRRSLPPE
jgi:hypothetical protein